LKDLAVILSNQSQGNHRSKFDKYHTLIIDEASMVTSHVFEALYQLIQFRRNVNNPAPFKGLQIILCGDFYQLPPIYRSMEPIKYIFDTNAWKKLVSHGLYAGELQHVHRQKDRDFLDVLEEVRHGGISTESYQLLMSTRDKTFSDGIQVKR
jgi:ATP-dependent DNA helicase PIF1